MEHILTATHVLFSILVSLAVGSSTLAVAGILYALRDGVLDASERDLLGVTYVVLRVAMVGLLASAVVLWWFAFGPFSAPLSPFALTLFVMLGILYLNAFLMTLHYMPRSIGPALQAGAWYTVGIGYALVGAGVTLGYAAYGILFATLVCTFFAVINGFMKFGIKKAQT
jgi:hypothetical protein